MFDRKSDYALNKKDPDAIVFKTAAGREVRDGGGITPDIKVTYGDVNRLTYNIVSDNWAFDYATKFRAENPAIAPAENFEITDSVFNDFKKFVDPEKFQYDKVCEQMIENLRKAAKTEGYMNDSFKNHIDKLEKLLHHNLDHDLDQNRKDIADLLATEILKRYYYQKGQIIQTLKNDAAIDTVMAIEAAPERYRQILAAPKADIKRNKVTADSATDTEPGTAAGCRESIAVASTVQGIVLIACRLGTGPDNGICSKSRKTSNCCGRLARRCRLSVSRPVATSWRRSRYDVSVRL